MAYLLNDLKSIQNGLMKQNEFKVLMCANNNVNKKLIFCRRFCKEVLFDIFEEVFTEINDVLNTTYDYSVPMITYNVKDKYVGFKFAYKDSPSSFFKKTLVSNLRKKIGKNVVVGFKKINEINDLLN